MSDTKSYIIATADEMSSFDFSQLPFTSAKNVRWNMAGTKAIIKYYGDQPSFFAGKTVYTYAEVIAMLTEVNPNNEWVYTDPDNELWDNWKG
tara:strand:- start:1934 stop:2209 length:276 start_codon:yes stop_codon:yes gene_type:complete